MATSLWSFSRATVVIALLQAPQRHATKPPSPRLGLVAAKRMYAQASPLADTRVYPLPANGTCGGSSLPVHREGRTAMAAAQPRHIQALLRRAARQYDPSPEMVTGRGR